MLAAIISLYVLFGVLFLLAAGLCYTVYEVQKKQLTQFEQRFEHLLQSQHSINQSNQKSINCLIDSVNYINESVKGTVELYKQVSVKLNQ